MKKNKRTGIYFIFDYTPKANHFFGKDFNPAVYNFKFFGHGMEEFRIIVECMTEILGCNTSVGIPSSGIEENNVQEICKKDIIFIPEYKRPSKHNYYPLILEEEKKRLKIEKKKNFKRVLLVDDIVTSGKTMKIYKKILALIGVKEIKMFTFAHKKIGEVEIKHAICLKDNFDLDLDTDLDKDLDLDISEVS
ncbi:MAG: phosphoribosyltransferase family protein [Candidatus Aerophobetes bacterium]|nr:phosphoribosyltransferase family protein [Candidatus Aerophobetes bacterium]